MKIIKRYKLYTLLTLPGVVDALFLFWTVYHFEEVSTPLFLLVRCLLAAGVLLLVKLQLWGNREGFAPPGLFVFTLFFVYSLFGIIAFIFVLNFQNEKKCKKGKLYHIDQEEGDVIEGESPLSVNVSIEELTRVAPLINGMTDEDKNRRIAAIQAMEQMIDSLSIREALVEARNDPDKEVQYFANDAIKKVTDQYMGEIKKQIDIVNEDPPTYESYKKLADLYGYLALADMDHPLMVRFYHQEAVKYYSYLIENYGDRKNDVLKKLIPTLYKNKEYEKCLNAVDEVEGVSELSSLAVLYRLKSLFKLRKMEVLKECVGSFDASGVIPGDNLFKGWG